MKTMFGWAMDKNVDDFAEVANALSIRGQKSRAEAVVYLIQRVKEAEAKISSLETQVKEAKEIAFHAVKSAPTTIGKKTHYVLTPDTFERLQALASE